MVKVFKINDKIFNADLSFTKFIRGSYFIGFGYNISYKNHSKTLVIINLNLTIAIKDKISIMPILLQSNYIKLKDKEKILDWSNYLINSLLNDKYVLENYDKEYIYYLIYSVFADEKVNPNDIFTDEFLNSDILCRALIKGGN